MNQRVVAAEGFKVDLQVGDQCGADDQQIERLAGAARQGFDFVERVHRGDAEVPQLVEDLFNVQALEVLIVSDQYPQGFIDHRGKPPFGCAADSS